MARCCCWSCCTALPGRWRFLGGCALVALVFGLGWTSVSVSGAAEVGAHLDPEAQTVLLWGVHQRFKQAVEEGQRPDPNVRYWQTQ